MKMDITDYEKHRISEQLKIEKQIFPECIQAPVKYFNKRKTLDISSKLAEKNKPPSIFPGELISPLKGSNMENSCSHVQKWLEENEKRSSKNNARKPFSNLNVNTPNIIKQTFDSSPIKRKADFIPKKAKENLTKSSRKQSHFKTSLATDKKQSNSDTSFKSKKKTIEWSAKKEKKQFDQYMCKDNNITDQDESGIVIDDDLIIIDDSESQGQIVDKDKLALLAVLEAAEKESNQYSSFFTPNFLDFNQPICDLDNHLQNKIASQKFETPVSKVPFYKKSKFEETCLLCKEGNDINKIIDKKAAAQTKDVSVTIENSSFITIIKMSNVKNNFKMHCEESIAVQTDIVGATDTVTKDYVSDTKQEKDNETISKESFNNVVSQDLFTAETKNLKECKYVPLKYLPNTLREHKLFSKDVKSRKIIPDSGSDDDLNQSEVIEVKAQVHRSSEQLKYSALTDLAHNDVNKSTRKRRGVRGPSPNSSNSSEKENYNPNKAKRIKLEKKDLKKSNRKKSLLSGTK